MSDLGAGDTNLSALQLIGIVAAADGLDVMARRTRSKGRIIIEVNSVGLGRTPNSSQS